VYGKDPDRLGHVSGSLDASFGSLFKKAAPNDSPNFANFNFNVHKGKDETTFACPGYLGNSCNAKMRM